ncbi:unconventional myosin-Vc isoform X3 [Oncorhynchus kisutch]|uniref:unconventional myosin-Vc isoform X3 n=1 Tax=Oncorhynchus kisutch TaxID=8019 RepID=UPI0012DC0DD9|nr:unconventional myosin-Vc-like isoform X3 [Oncorhynchus kisutch]
MALSELYTKYNRVWIPDEEHVWKSAEILRDFKPGDDTLQLQFEDGTEMLYSLDTSSPQLPHLRNPDILVGENDLTALSYLHEPAVLHNLKVRFVESKIIYTYCGIILVAVNPYKQLHIYGDAVIHAYSGQNMGDMDPHIFAVAEEAYKQMARNNKNQSIIVSGESGAGKTVSARYAMRYFAMVSKSGSKTHVEDKVLASNPITEAIGNAKTTRNDNSSRFGKYTEISFDRRYQIIGANMRTYLLEKSRVVSQSESERNYHIFYQMCACADQPEFKSLRLLRADEFRYTSMGGETAIEGVDDRKDMEETRRTFSLLGLTKDFQADVFKVLAGILHLGNVAIRNVGSDRSSISSSDPHIAAFCDLLGVSPDGVTRWLCHRRFVMVAETVVKPVTSKRAVNARDALAKQIYAHLFDCVIQKINAALQVPGKQHSFIGVLDIYGFETFDINSFEQFCINYANEKLQQQFNLHVFKLEQEEYMKEDIPWTLIDFYDNQPVIDLIEAKMGILDLLDEECLFPQGTDQNWLQKLYNYLADNPLFEKPRMSNEAFIIQHFADKVEYQCWGFLEKNRDTLYEELIDTMRTSKFPLLANFFLEEEPGGVGSKGIKVRPARPGVKPTNKNLRTTVGEKFRSSLYLLMETLNATTPHYVRCIKPNEEKMPFEYDSKRVVQQLRACGVLETIHISAQSYPSRWTYIEFYSRYSILMSQQELVLTDKKQTCRTVLQRLIQDSNQYKFGRTKIFFRAGQVAYLEKLRLDRLRGACVTIQKHVRGWSHRRTFLRMREAAIILQQYVRGQRRIRKSVTAAALKQGWAAVVIQRYWRGHLTRQIFRMVRSSSIIIQAFTRGWIARKRYKKMVEVQKALILQKYARAWLARRRFQTLRRLVHNVQLSYRCQQLRKKLEDQGKENCGLLERLTSLAGAHAQGLDKLHSLEAQLGKSATEKASLEERSKKSKEDAAKTIAQLQQEKDGFIVQKQDLEKKLADTATEMKDGFDQIKTTLKEDLEREERLRKIAENNLDLQKEDHEKEVEILREENRRLKEERVRLQRQTEEGAQVNTDLQDQVIQLTKHVKVIPELRKDLHNLQTQRDDLDRRMKGQSEEAIAKMSVITRQLLGGMMEEEVISRLASDGPEQIYEAGDLLTAFDGLQKATRVLERKQKEQKEVSDSQVEGLTFKVEHLQNENNQLQKLFQEKMSVNDSIGQEVTRLNQENMVIPELKQTVSELQRHKQELEEQLEEQTRGMTEQIEEISKKLQMNVEEEASQRRLLEQHEQVEREKEEVERRVEELEEVLRRQKNTETEAKTRFTQEASRLTAENMDFEEQLDMKDRLIRKLQNKIKSLQTSEKANQTPAPTIPKEYLGMLEYKREDEPKLIQYIILDLKPRGVVVNMIPNMAAQLLFMCVRHADYLNDGAKLKSLMNAIISGVKKVITDHQADFELLSFWLSNMYHMLNCLKQYSGEEEFMKQNSPRQKKNCLQNFDLSEHRQIFSDLAIRIYHQFISVMEKALMPMIVPGMLEHESLQGISSMKPTGFRKRSSSIYEDQEIYTISSLLQQLSLYHSTMSQHGMEEGLVRQAVKQTFFLVGAATLNNILLRKDMCSCRKGMQIRCNISYLEEWLKEKDLVQGTSAMETLKPLCQAAWLLQVNKTTDDDAKEIIEQCSELNTVQIVKILNSYTPIDDFEKRVAPSFVRKVQGLLQDREGGSSQLMLDTQYRFQVTFPFTPSSQALELLQLPSSLRLGFITRI